MLSREEPHSPPRGVDQLTFVSMSTVPGQTVFSLRRQSAKGRTVPTLTEEFHPVELTSPAGATLASWIDGGATFVADTNEIVSITVATGVPTFFPRLHSPAARAFLSQFVIVP